MKKSLLMAGLCLTTLSGFAQTAQGDRGREESRTSNARGVSGTSSAETAKIVMACINQPSFEKYYAANGRGPVNVINLPAGVQLPAKAYALGRTLNLGSLDQVAAGSLSNYFFIGNIANANEQISASLTYFYNHSKEGYKVVMVDVQLMKNGDQYQIVNSNFNGDLL